MCGRFTQTDKDLPGFSTLVLDEEIDSRAQSYPLQRRTPHRISG